LPLLRDNTLYQNHIMLFVMKSRKHRFLQDWRDGRWRERVRTEGVAPLGRGDPAGATGWLSASLVTGPTASEVARRKGVGRDAVARSGMRWDGVLVPPRGQQLNRPVGRLA
jgi:hypothetical protein